jgi:hypothetical protein
MSFTDQDAAFPSRIDDGVAFLLDPAVPADLFRDGLHGGGLFHCTHQWIVVC